jgi:phospholipid-binding lipoprotein MlaA
MRDNAPSDPLQSVNIKAFELTHSVDKAVFRPVALAYRHGLPSPIRSGLRNVLTNLNEPVVFANYLVQHHPGKAAETLARFTINSIIGVAGLFDVAKTRRFNLPHHPNGFADTLGFYGVKSGPFLYLPLIGPSTVRDLFGDVVDRLTCH